MRTHRLLPAALLAAHLVSAAPAFPLNATVSLSPSNTTTTTAAATCHAGVYLVVARGSTEDPGEGKPASVAALVTARVPDSVDVPVDYPASLLDPPYEDSLAAGVADAAAKVRAYVDACVAAARRPRVALVGFSQGGQVMTNAVAGTDDEPPPLTEEYTKYITAITVFGDPSFTAGQPFDSGTATRNGIFTRSGASLAILRTFDGVLKSFCLENDLICASGLSLKVHSSEVSTFEREAADFIVSHNS